MSYLKTKEAREAMFAHQDHSFFISANKQEVSDFEFEEWRLPEIQGHVDIALVEGGQNNQVILICTSSDRILERTVDGYFFGVISEGKQRLWRRNMRCLIKSHDGYFTVLNCKKVL